MAGSPYATRGEHPARRFERGAAAAVRTRRDQCDQALRVQRGEVVARECAVAVVVGCRFGEAGGQAREQRGVLVGRHRQAAQGLGTHGFGP